MAIGDKIVVNDKMQTGYFYELAAPAGDNFHSEFKPYYDPKEMLEMGVFEGKYCNDCTVPRQHSRDRIVSLPKR